MPRTFWRVIGSVYTFAYLPLRMAKFKGLHEIIAIFWLRMKTSTCNYWEIKTSNVVGFWIYIEFFAYRKHYMSIPSCSQQRQIDYWHVLPFKNFLNKGTPLLSAAKTQTSCRMKRKYFWNERQQYRKLYFSLIGKWEQTSRPMVWW
jgi:hypothetical protein